MSFGYVKSILDANGVSYNPEELDTRMTLLVKALRGQYDENEMEEFIRNDPGGDYAEIPKVSYSQVAGMVGGTFKMPEFKMPTFGKPKELGKPKSDPDDFLTPSVRWVVEGLTSPNATIFRTGLRILFLVIFFVSYLEKLPVMGGILGAALDLTVGASKAATKLIQKGIVSIFGIIPFGGIIGIMLATIFGLFAWFMIGALSFSRQEFADAVSAGLRMITYPIGDMIGDVFDSGNRIAGKIYEKSGKIWGNIKDVLSYFGTLNPKAKEGVDKIISKVQEAKPTLANPPMPKDALEMAKAKYGSTPTEVLKNVKSKINTEGIKQGISQGITKGIDVASTAAVKAKDIGRQFQEQVAQKSATTIPEPSAPPSSELKPSSEPSAPEEEPSNPPAAASSGPQLYDIEYGRPSAPPTVPTAPPSSELQEPNVPVTVPLPPIDTPAPPPTTAPPADITNAIKLLTPMIPLIKLRKNDLPTVGDVVLVGETIERVVESGPAGIRLIPINNQTRKAISTMKSGKDIRNAFNDKKDDKRMEYFDACRTPRVISAAKWADMPPINYIVKLDKSAPGGVPACKTFKAGRHQKSKWKTLRNRFDRTSESSSQ